MYAMSRVVVRIGSEYLISRRVLDVDGCLDSWGPQTLKLGRLKYVPRILLELGTCSGFGRFGNRNMNSHMQYNTAQCMNSSFEAILGPHHELLKYERTVYRGYRTELLALKLQDRKASKPRLLVYSSRKIVWGPAVRTSMLVARALNPERSLLWEFKFFIAENRGSLAYFC